MYTEASEKNTRKTIKIFEANPPKKRTTGVKYQTARVERVSSYGVHPMVVEHSTVNLEESQAGHRVYMDNNRGLD